MKPVVEKLFENAEKTPDKLAVVFEDEKMTYGQLRDAIILFSSWMKQNGVSEGDRVIVQAFFSPWFAVACFATHLCGATFVPIEKGASFDAVNSITQWMEGKLVISKYEISDVLSVKIQSFSEILSGIEKKPYTFPSLDLVADIMLTSGTTGVQKGVRLTQKNIAINSQVRINELGIHGDSVGITLLPINHVGATRVLYPALYSGNAYIFLDGILKLKKMFEYMEEYHVNSFNLSPSAVSSMEQLSKNKIHEFANQIEYAYIHASPIQPPQQVFLKKMLPYSKLFFSYGSSENGTVSLLRFDQDEKDVSCVGLPCDGVHIRVLDEDFKEKKTGEIGRVAILSEMNFIGYWKRPELNRAVFKESFFLTSDEGYLDDEGYLYIVGRIDDVINIGGLKVHPTEIENATAAIDGVIECICFRIPDSTAGSVPKLLIKRDPEIQLDAKTVSKELSKRLDPYKVPKIIEFVDEIAKNSMGKPDRKYYELEIIGK